MNSSLSLYELVILCFHTSSGWSSAVAFSAVNIPLLLPVCLYVLYLGLLQWRQRVPISHSDTFTFHVAAIQIVGAFASTLNLIAIDLDVSVLNLIGIFLFYLNTLAYLQFQMLTCAERYLAVLHPVTYLRLKRQTLARNMVCGLVWLLCVIQCFGFLSAKVNMEDFVAGYVIMSLTISFVLFCNISVMVVLLRPRPGDGGRKKQPLRRAFYTMSVILGSLVLKSVGDIVGSVVAIIEGINVDIMCGMWFTPAWFSLPSTLTLPLLYLHRAGKLSCCRRTEAQSAQ